MKTEPRLLVEDELFSDKKAAERAARDASERHRAELRELPGQDDDAIDATEVEPEPVEVLVDAYNVLSERDGEVVVREVPHDTAVREAQRLAAEQHENRREQPIHDLIPDDSATPAGQPPAWVPHDPTPHPGYRVERAPERIIDTTEEA